MLMFEQRRVTHFVNVFICRVLNLILTLFQCFSCVLYITSSNSSKKTELLLLIISFTADVCQ